MEPENQHYEGEQPAVAQEQEYYLPVYRKGGSLFVTEGAVLPTDICINSGKQARKVVTPAIRNPKNPLTWFGPQPRIEMGLSRKHQENLVLARTATYSLLAVGVVILIAGVITLSVGSIVFGLLAMLICGVFRARLPVWSPNTKEEPIELRGVGEEVLQLFPKVEQPD